MSELHQSIQRALDALVGERAEQGNWTRVLSEADRGNRRAWVVRVAVVAAAAIAIVGAALVSPFEDEQQPIILRTGVLGKALAAIGDGPVIHLVTRGDWGGTLVDLSTGELTPVYAETELWHDPDRGTHYLSRFGDQVSFDRIVQPAESSSHETAQYVALANRYRDELKSGKAKVVARGRVGGRPILWIRVRSEWFPDVADGREHLFAEEVAVDRKTYEPVYMRSTRDGREPDGAGQLILKLETLPSGEGDFTAEESAHPMEGSSMRIGPIEHLSREELAAALDGKALWLGERQAGKPLVESKVIEFARRPPDSDEWQDIVRGVQLFYGSLLPKRGGIRMRDDQKPFVQLTETTELSPAQRGTEYFHDLSEGSVLIDAGGTGYVVRDGVYVSISAHEVRDVLEAAAGLRGVGDPLQTPSPLDFEALAGRIDSRELVRVEGGAPVKPREIVSDTEKPLQTAVSKGVKVETYPSAARVDTRGMDSELQRLMPKEVSGRCFRVQGDVAGRGVTGSLPRDGVRLLAMHSNPVRPPADRRPAPRRFDGCEIGAQFGRNWLPRFDWHWPIEFALTDRGRRFFEERAAALELAHFIRNGSRLRARKAMKRGGAPPPIEGLRDPARPYIRVTPIPDGFRAAMHASNGRRFFIEIKKGRIGRSNANRLAFVR